MCEECKQHLDKLHDAMEDLKQHQIASIPQDIDEYLYIPSSVKLTLPAQVRNQVRITALIAQCSSTAVLTIGLRTWVLNAGLYTWIGLHIILNADDIRTIAQNQAGILSLELMGESLVDTMVW